MLAVFALVWLLFLHVCDWFCIGLIGLALRPRDWGGEGGGGHRTKPKQNITKVAIFTKHDDF